MFTPEYNSFIVIVDYPVMGGDRAKAYAFQHEDGTFYQLDSFEPLTGDVEIIGHTDTVIAYCMEGGTITDSNTFVLQENVAWFDDECV